MVFSKEDQLLIRNLYESKGHDAKKVIKELPYKRWNMCGLHVESAHFSVSMKLLSAI